MSEPTFKLDLLLGSVELDSELRLEGDSLLGYSRRRVFDRDGKLVETTPWQRTGVRLYFPDPVPSGVMGWWQRRKQRAILRSLPRPPLKEESNGN